MSKTLNGLRIDLADTPSAICYSPMFARGRFPGNNQSVNGTVVRQRSLPSTQIRLSFVDCFVDQIRSRVMGDEG